MRNAVRSFLPLLAVLLMVVGCGRDETRPTQRAAAVAPAKAAADGASQSAVPEDGHEHAVGAHGGSIVSLGGDSYHAEAIFERGGLVRLFTLGDDESIVLEVDAQKLVAYVAIEGESEWTPVSFEPIPVPGDAPGKTSQFVATLPAELAGGSVEVTVPNIVIAGERYRMAFASNAEANRDDEMPDKIADDEERQLYLTPGGLYTDADIVANGRRTASERFRAFKSSHDMHPQPGDNICPITLTKANPDCTWIIGGKTYEFCCPPCVDEFLQLAKENPAAIGDPATYVK